MDTEDTKEVNNIITRVERCVDENLQGAPLELVITAVCAFFMLFARRVLREGCPDWVARLFASVCHTVLGEVEAHRLRQ